MPSKPRRFLRSFVALAAPLATLTLTSVAHGQQPVSDADRAAARELATQGLQLQQAGNFADALDRFDRAQAVFSAPTHLLHIAQCEAALGKLVESAETYRTLVRTPLPPGAPNAFVQAQQQAATELAQVEPRLPSIRVIVRPRTIPNTTIQLDGQSLSAALVGVARPTDPGPHTVVLLAPGYARAEQHIVLNEKEIKDVAFNLGGATGAYAPPPAAAAEPTPTYQQPPPQPFYPATSEGFPPAAPPQKTEARGGFMLGATAGVLIPAGGAYQGASMGSLVGPGAAIGLDAGFRFVRRLYLGLTFEHAFLGAGSALTANFPPGGSANADSNYIGLDFAFISDPNGTAFYGKVGAGYRYLDLGVTEPDGTFSATLSGAELSLSMGIQLKLGAWVRLIPEASVNVGSFNSANCSAGSPLGSECGSIPNTDTHEFVLLGAKLFLDFARKN